MYEYRVELTGSVEESAEQEPALKDALRRYKLFHVEKIEKITEDSDADKYPESRARNLLEKRPYVIVTADSGLKEGGQFALLSKTESGSRYAYPRLKISGYMTLDESAYSSVSVNGVTVID